MPKPEEEPQPRIEQTKDDPQKGGDKSQRFKNLFKSTSYKQLEERLYPLESGLPLYFKEKNDIYDRANSFREKACQAAEEAMASYDSTIQTISQVITISSNPNSTISGNISIISQSQLALNKVQVTINKCRQATSAAIQTIQTVMGAQTNPPAVEIDSPALVKAINENSKKAITILEEALKTANIALNKSPPITQVPDEVEKACYASQQVAYAAQDAANAVEQSLKQVYNDLLSGQRAVDNITQAKEALAQGKVQQAWGHYYEAELSSYYLVDEDALKATAQKIIHSSSDEISDGERKTVRSLIGNVRSDGGWELKENVKREDVIAARRIVQEHYTDEYTILNMTLGQLKILVTVAALLIIGTIALLVVVPNVGITSANFEATNFFATNVQYNNTSVENFTATGVAAQNVIASGSVSVGNPYFMIAIALFGALGGTFSALTALGGVSQAGIPERLANSWLSLAKPIVGAIASVAIFVFLLGGFVQITQSLSNYLIFALAFASGFSERLILGAISKTEGAEKQS